MKYERQKRVIPNQIYDEIHRDEVKYLFDVLQDNSTTNIVKETGYNINFVSKTISDYINGKMQPEMAQAS